MAKFNAQIKSLEYRLQRYEAPGSETETSTGASIWEGRNYSVIIIVAIQSHVERNSVIIMNIEKKVKLIEIKFIAT